MILGALGAVEAALRDCGIPIGEGALQSAVQAARAEYR
jgi:alanine-glyoxylate transaminase/serine-glyoxylate transaminase/serine-pyruvate transaminase